MPYESSRRDERDALHSEHSLFLSTSSTLGEVKPEVILNNVSLRTPAGEDLIQNLDLVVDRGTSVIIIGPSGCGKSSLLRTIAGLWEPSQVNIYLPGKSTPMFLPQNVYIPDVTMEDNTLKSQLLFPNENFINIPDAKLIKALQRVNLHHLMKEKGIYTTGNWRSQLSGGEKQRLTMARLLITKPEIAFLDESTSALDPENERRTYEALRRRKATYISVGHKMELKKYHSHILELKNNGDCDFYESPEYQEAGSKH